MKLKHNLLIALALLSSCATMINSPFQKVNIDHEPGFNVRVDTSQFYYKAAEVYNVYIPKDYYRTGNFFLRSKNEIPLIVNEYDTLRLKPHRSYFAFWFGNIYISMGLGMLIDYNNDKSYEYPIYNYIAKVNDKFQNIRFKPIPAKSLRFSLTVPTLNFFYLQTDSGKISTGSGFGISGQVEYFFTNNLYLSVNGGLTSDLFHARRDTVDDRDFREFYWGFDTYSSTKYFNIRINKITPGVEYGIGITFLELKWRENNRIDLTDSTHTFSQSYYKSYNLGLSGAIAFRLTPNFNIGLQYQPSFFDLSRKKYTYQSFFSTQMIWRF
jgi:hypothetical protein